MRGKLLLIPVVIVVVGVFTMVPQAYAGWKHCKGTVKLIEPGPDLIFDLDDWPSHQVALEKSISGLTCDCAELDGARQINYEFREEVQAVGPAGFAYYTLETKGGDKIFGKSSYQGRKVIKKDGSWEVPVLGEWEEFDGTGKMKGIKGKGTYWGKVTSAPVPAEYEWEGDYWFPDLIGK